MVAWVLERIADWKSFEPSWRALGFLAFAVLMQWFWVCDPTLSSDRITVVWMAVLMRRQSPTR